MRATIDIETEIEAEQTKAAMEAAMKESDEIEKIKKESAAVAALKAAQDAAGGTDVGTALSEHLSKNYVSTKNLHVLLAGMGYDRQPKPVSASKGKGRQKSLTAQKGNGSERKRETHSGGRGGRLSPKGKTARKLQWSPPQNRQTHQNDRRNNSSGGCSSGRCNTRDQKRPRDDRDHRDRNRNQDRRGTGGRGKR